MSNNEFRVEDIFLVYANRLFKDDPNYLHYMVAVIEEFETKYLINIGIDYLKQQEENIFPAESPNILSSDLLRIVSEILRLSDLGEHNADIENAEQKCGHKFIPDNFINIPYAAAYRYNNVDPYGQPTPCEYCLYFEEREGLPFMNEPRKCFECDQLAFVAMLDQLIEGREIDMLPEFRFYLRARNRAVVSVVNFDISKDDTFKSSLIKYDSFDTVSHFYRGRNDFDYVQYAFSQFLMIFVGYSLTEFLLNNNRRKLKKCPYCDEYFIANDLRRKKCYSDDCKKTYERRKKRKQREDEPEIYI